MSAEVVHVSSEHRGGFVSGHELDRFEKRASDWRAIGYTVAPVPADGREHPHDQTCPVCSGDA